MNPSPTKPTQAAPPGPASRAGFTLPELLAPAGDWDCVRAAVENGADAVYFGLDRFNARMRADNFTESDLPPLMAYLHGRGVKGYVTLNTLVFADELAEAEQFLKAMIKAGVDAVVVQDVGICRLIRRLSPDFPIHASTQMTITSAAGVRLAEGLGCNLVVLARECSIREIERIREELAQGEAPGAVLPLEVFVHGALCVAYSGQCLTSEALGGRSANRGECAQACRMPYELLADGRPVALGDRRYLLSPQDLAGLEVLPDLVRAGVVSLKIEGRLKTPEYVANITRVYRDALDALEQPAGAAAARPPASRAIDDSVPYRMEMAFSRGLHTGWLGGTNNQALVHGRFGKKRGVYLGQVVRRQANGIVVNLEGPLKPGDGVVFDAGRPDEPEEGGRVYAVIPLSPPDSGQSSRPQAGVGPGMVTLEFGRGDLDLSRIRPGDRLWKTSDPELDRRLRQSYAGDQPRHQRPVWMDVAGQAGQPLVLALRDEEGRTVQVQSHPLLQAADNAPLTAERLRQQLGRLGGTPFRLADLTSNLTGPVILPVSELNRLRRDAVAKLQVLRTQPLRWTLRSADEPASRLSSAPAPPTPSDSELIVLVRSFPQLEAALRSHLTTFYCEFENPKHYRAAVEQVRQAQPPSSSASHPREIWVAPPRIHKPGETWILNQVASCQPDGFLIRNYDDLEFFKGRRCVGDFSFNVANPWSADYWISRWGLERVTASYDLNIDQLEALLKSAPPAWFEITLHQHMPMFHMEHCIFCAFLSQGTDYTNCGRPCDRHEVRLRDRVGVEHAVKADAGCRNTVFNGRAQTGAEYAGRLQALGARRFRVEFVSETADQVTTTIAKYQGLLRGELSGAHLWRELKLQSQLGVTRGPLER